MKSCDLEIVWGVKSAEFFALRRQQSFAHTIILGEPLIQELKPAKSRTLWTHAAWDYPNGWVLRWTRVAFYIHLIVGRGLDCGNQVRDNVEAVV